jgi:nitrite reductase/ring-hydroxylating ferredoxin subunit
MVSRGLLNPRVGPEMSEFVTVAKVGAIAEGRGETFTVNGRLVAVFKSGNDYHAIDDLCPHMGASLGAGAVHKGIVTCPWHAWRFRVCDGVWCDNPKVKIDRFEVRIVGEEIQVSVPGTSR